MKTDTAGRTLKATVCAVALMLADLACGASAGPPWTEAAYTHYADNRAIPKVIDEFGQQFGARVKLGAKVQALTAAVNGKIAASGPSDFLNKLCAMHGLVWFYQGGTIHVDAVSESAVRAIPAQGIKGGSLKTLLLELGYLDPKFGWAELPERDSVIVSGPPQYVESVAQAIANLPAASSEQRVAVFKLRYASVDDRTTFYRDKQIHTAGIVTTLRGLISGTGGQGGTRIQILEPGGTPLPSLAAANALPSLGAEEPRAQPLPLGLPVVPGKSGTTASGAPSAKLAPVIQADSRLNAVLVKDTEDRMPIYEKLIAQLDVPTAMVEIEAMIIDVDVNKTSELGVAWARSAGGISTGYGVASGAPEVGTFLYERRPPAGPTALADAGAFLLSRVRLLESTGNAQVNSRPSIVTHDNMGALFDLSETFHVQVVSERAANLVPVTTGVTFKVTPHIIEENGKRLVQLGIDIQDGKITDTQIQSLPTVRNSTISTQAVVRENESLLIGGYVVEERGKKREGVPVLGNLPVVGALFGSQKDETKRRERMFLITPRIVPSP